MNIYISTFRYHLGIFWKINNVLLSAKEGLNAVNFVFWESHSEFWVDSEGRGGGWPQEDMQRTVMLLSVLGVLWWRYWGSLVRKSKMQIRRLDKKIKDPWCQEDICQQQLCAWERWSKTLPVSICHGTDTREHWRQIPGAWKDAKRAVKSMCAFLYKISVLKRKLTT